jgi:hypothetical protein
LGLPADLLNLPGAIYSGVTGKESYELPFGSEYIEKRLPFRGASQTPVGELFTGAGQLAGGAYTGPLSGARAAMAVPRAAVRAGRDFVQAAGQPAVNVIKPPGGNWLSGSVERAMEPLKRYDLPDLFPELGSPPPNSVANKALNQWIDRNLANYVKKQMATPDDPVRGLAERGIETQGRFQYAPERNLPTLQIKREQFGFPKEGVGQSPQAKNWEKIADETIGVETAGDIIKIANSTDAISRQKYQGILKENPWLLNVDPSTPVYSPKAGNWSYGDTGFDHVVDVLKQDLDAGRIRPEQLNKVSMEQAVRRTAEFDQEMAKRMREAQIKATEGMPVYKEYPEGYRWIELKAPEVTEDILSKLTPSERGYYDRYLQSGDSPMEALRGAAGDQNPAYKALESALKYEGETMGHCVGGYCPDVAQGRSRIYSLRDAKGEPHVTVEVEPRSLDTKDWFFEQPNEIVDEIRSMVGNSPTPAQMADVIKSHPKYIEDSAKVSPAIVQIKGKQNRAPNEQYLPFVQDFVRSGQWSGVGDFKNTGLYRKGDFIDEFTPEQLDAVGKGEYLTMDEIKTLREGKTWKPIDTDPDLDINLDDLGMKAGGEVKMAEGGAAFGRYTTGKKYQGAVKRAKEADVNTLADPRTYAAVMGLLGSAPDQLGFSVMHPDYKGIQKAGERGFVGGTVLGIAPAVAPLTRGLPVGASIKPVGGGPLTARQAPQEKALLLAKQNAEKLGQSADPETRMLQQGYEPDWYHGSTGDITRFRSDLLGETTGAQSAKKGFFFARDPQNPPESMLKKSNDPATVDMLRKAGIPEEEIAKLNTVSMKGHGPETASGYALLGGSREYKEAMRKANAAEKRRDWPEYEKQMQIAEDSEITRMQYGQGLVAKYGDARDEMLEGIKNVWYGPQNSERFKNMSQADYEAYDKKFKELMPYGWYNSYSNPQLEVLKKKLVETVGEKAAEKVLGKINKFQSVRNERALIEKTQEGGNVMPVALRYEKPMVHDFEGKPYRDQSYSDLVDQALAAGNDALILKNTYDPGGGPSRLVDVGVVFNPDQIRSKFAAFDPLRKTAATAAASGLAAPDLLAEEQKKASGGEVKSDCGCNDEPKMQAGGATSLLRGLLSSPAKKLTKAEMDALRVQGLGVPGQDFADVMNPADVMRMSEALGNAGAEGKTINITQTDRSRVFGQNRGGPGFSGLQLTSVPHQQAGSTWGVGKPSHATRLINANTPDTIWSTFIGSPTQHMSNPVTVERIFKEHQKGNAPVDLIERMNQRLNDAVHPKTGKLVFPNGIDVSSPSALSSAQTFDQRKLLAETLAGKGVGGPKKGGSVVDAAKIIREETDPLLMGSPTYSVGPRLWTIDKDVGIYRPDLNAAFPYQVTGTDLGMVFEPTPIEIAALDFVSRFEGRKNKSGKLQPMGHKDLTATTPKQFVSDKYLTFLQKEGYADGGPVSGLSVLEKV